MNPKLTVAANALIRKTRAYSHGSTRPAMTSAETSSDTRHPPYMKN